MKFDFKRRVLKNGMTVILEKRDLPIVSVAFAVRNGAINENLDEKGISHFIEHMLYKGTPTRDTKKIAEEIEKNGGELNGFTSEEITAYWCKMPSEHLKIALDVLSDIVKNPKFDEIELDKERKVIFEEIKMKHDTPISHVFDEITKLLYDDEMVMSILGTYETLDSINREKIVGKFQEIYTSNNMILIVVGDADFEKLCEFAEKTFPSKKGKIPEQKFKLKNNKRIEERYGLDQANLVFAYHVALTKNKKSFAARILSALMAEGLSSRLFLEIREKRNLAYGVKGGSDVNKRFAYNFVYVGTMKENIDLVKKLIIEEFEKVAKELGEDELNQVKKQLIGQYKISMEDSQVQMVNLLSCEVSGEVKNFYEFEKNIRDVKLEDVRELAKKASKKYSFFALVPKD